MSLLMDCLRDEGAGEIVEIAVLVAVIVLGCIALLTLMGIPATDRLQQLARTVWRG